MPKTPSWNSIKYTRYTPCVQGKKSAWSRTLKDILTASGKQCVTMLTADGITVLKQGSPCPKCGAGFLGRLLKRGDSSSPRWCYACSRCKQRVNPAFGHPIFTDGHGSKMTPLQDQAGVLFCCVANTTQKQAQQMTGVPERTVRRIYSRLHALRAKHVVRQERKIRFGKLMPWNDVEADEVDLRRTELPAGTATPSRAVSWEQWGGVVERGAPQTLVLTRLNPKLTSKRAPGPGPIRSGEWKDFANRRLRNARVVLHTDGAKAYRRKIAGVCHDFVVHQKKKVNGVWVKPTFVKRARHTLPDKTTLWVKAGTQVIDRAWQFLRRHIHNHNGDAGSESLARMIRSAQWAYWHRDSDLWAATGRLISHDASR